VEKKENADLDPSLVLLHGVRDSTPLDYAVYDAKPIPPPSAPANLVDAVYVSRYSFFLLLTQPRLGTWNLVVFGNEDDETSSGGMIRLDFMSGPDAEGHPTFSANGIYIDGTSLVVEGQVYGVLETPTIIFSINVGGYALGYCYGPVNTNGATSAIAFAFGYPTNSLKNTKLAIISRTAEDILRFRPSPKAFRENKPRALWDYAIKAVRDRVRRSRLSSSYVAERRGDRQRFLDLAKRMWYCGRSLNREEVDEHGRILQRLRWTDARFYMSMIQFDLQENPDHRYGPYQTLTRLPITEMICFRPVRCDSCRGFIGG
jgi:hypothetical protein